MMLHYAGLDDRVNATAPAWVDALKKAGTDVRSFTYEGANHAFHNDTSAARYDPAAARLAWDRSIAFFSEKLKAPAVPAKN
jgi:carboxymethylenebutenolidase